jgi:hypothetical protein
LDLRNRDADIFAGFQIYEWIWDSWFCPIVVYSAFSEEFAKYPPHPFVKRVQKGMASVEQIKSALAEFRPHIKALYDAERQIRQQFAIALREVGPYAFSAFTPGEAEKRSEIIFRAGRRRLAALSDRDPRDGKALASWEQYIFPPVTEDLSLGDILYEKGKDGPASFNVVLTPSCDLVASVGRPPKVSSVLLARCCDISDAIQGTSLGKIGAKKLKDRLPSTVLSQGYFEAILPLPALPDRIPHMAANLRDLRLIPFEEIAQPEGPFERIASIDSPFRELIAWAYMQIGCRPGLPDRDFESWCEEIIKLCETDAKGEN